MIKYSLIAFLCLFGSNIFAQLDSVLIPDSCVVEKNIFIGDPIPQFPGGMINFSCYLEDHIDFNLVNNLENTGRAYYVFTVDTLGNVLFDTVYRSLSAKLDLDIIRILEKSPKWTPGKINGKNANIKMTLPFRVPYIKKCKNKSISDKIETLKYVTDMPYICRDTIGGENSVGCGDNIFWDIVLEKDKAVPLLIEKLTDTTQTSIAVPNCPYKYTVADVAYQALQEIIDEIPTFELLGIKYNRNSGGYCSYWKHLSNFKNRVAFKHQVKKWYYTNKNNFIWIESQKVLTGDCSFTHPNNGHYLLK